VREIEIDLPGKILCLDRYDIQCQLIPLVLQVADVIDEVCKARGPGNLLSQQGIFSNTLVIVRSNIDPVLEKAEIDAGGVWNSRHASDTYEVQRQEIKRRWACIQPP